MSKTEAKIEKRRLRSSYITSTISISLVLFLLGMICLMLLNTKKLSDYVKENIGFSIILNENVKEVDILRLKKSLDAREYVKYSEYITKEQAAIETRDYLGEDFVDFLGYNPLPSSIEIKLYASYANQDSIDVIEQRLEGNEMIKEVYYQESLVHIVNENVKRISFVILVFSGVLFIIAFTLINNTIRMAVYSKRFIINTMQLVGATRSFIRRPFMLNSILHGTYGAFLAILYLIGLIYLIQNELKEYLKVNDFAILGILFFLVFLLGVFITSVSTFFAVNKYLRMKTDDLYY
jgi:cell division transport system permease protein